MGSKKLANKKKRSRKAEAKQFDEEENNWCPEFSTFRKIHDDKRLVDVREEQLDAVGNNIEIFFATSGNMDSRSELEEVKDFCRDESLTDVITGKGPAGLQRIAWIDDRNSGPYLGSKAARDYKNPITATGLFRALEEPQFNHKHLPDAARRLIYVTDLSPACIYALIATATWLQANALRDAISKHLAFQTSIAVKIPSDGITTFQLDLHLPFFILDESAPPPEPLKGSSVKPRRRRIDLSFLKLDPSEPQREVQEPKEVWGIQEAQISCVVAGTDNWRWIAYGFVDTEIDGVLAESSYDELSFDQIAAVKLKANTPIWSPRDYWIRVFEIRIDYVSKQWLYLIRKLEHSVNQYIEDHSPDLSSSGRSGREQPAQVKADFDWARQIIDILSRLSGVLSDTVVSWESFNSPGEDIGYFRDISEPGQLSLRKIKSTFRELQGDEKRLDLLKSRCTEFSRALELRLHLEVKEAAIETGTTSELNTSVFYPIALAAAIFSMQQEAVPFKMSPRSFGLATLLLMVIVYAIRFIFKRALRYWPLLQSRVVLWFKRDKVVDNGSKPPDIEV